MATVGCVATILSFPHRPTARMVVIPAGAMPIVSVQVAAIQQGITVTTITSSTVVPTALPAAVAIRITVTASTVVRCRGPRRTVVVEPTMAQVPI